MLSRQRPEKAALAAGLLLLLLAAAAPAQVTLTRGTNFAVDANRDGRLAMDLLGTIWSLPERGGRAEIIAGEEAVARRPRWAPDGERLVFQLRESDRQRLVLLDAGGETTPLGDGAWYDQHPAWHPDGNRIVFSSDRDDTGFDLWETDLPTGISWRLTTSPGNETEPAWSADGRDLAFIHYARGTWSLVLRRHGQPDRVLESASRRLSSPAWRPDGSLITFLRHGEAGLSIEMVILSDPPLVRPLVTGEDFFVAPVAWRDRHQILYTADGHIRTRLFNAWNSSDIPFRATIDVGSKAPPKRPERRPLPPAEAPSGRLVVRVGRVFDGLAAGYRDGADIVIDGNRITAVEPVAGPDAGKAQADRDGAIVVDLGDLTAVPGLIDADAALPEDVSPALGPVLLSFGVTTLATAHPQAAELDRTWSGKAMPGPRVLGRDWLPELDAATSLVLDRDALPVSPLGIRYEDFRLDAAVEPATVISGLADARTACLDALLASRQAALLGTADRARHFVDKPRLGTASAAVVLGSRPNGLPPGIAQQAELCALVEAGLTPRRALESAGPAAAGALGAGLTIGRIGPGAAADFIIVDGDPLADVTALQRVVAVVRNGRFHSVIGLLEKAQAANDVE